jgi:hypothetical protein
MSKRDQIRMLHAQGLTPQQITAQTGYLLNYVYTTLWRDRHPRYHRDYMARYRRTDPNYYQTELEQQRMSRWKT